MKNKAYINENNEISLKKPSKYRRIYDSVKWKAWRKWRINSIPEYSLCDNQYMKKTLPANMMFHPDGKYGKWRSRRYEYQKASNLCRRPSKKWEEEWRASDCEEKRGRIYLWKWRKRKMIEIYWNIQYIRHQKAMPVNVWYNIVIVKENSMKCEGRT